MSPEKQLTILIIDDNLVNQRILQTTLAKVGYRILTADNGREGRTLANTEQPDIIILDIMMPGEDGFTVIKKLSSRPKTRDIPVIFLTADADPGSKIIGFELGAVDYIVKPFNHAEVLARVKVHLRLRLATQALIATQKEKLQQVSKAQASMLLKPENLQEAQFGVHYTSLCEAGGDFYDVLRIAPDIFSYLVADVAGHDIGTSFVTAAMKALLKQNSSLLYEPAETLTIINQVLLGILPRDKYLTCVYVRLSRATNKLTLAGAGHPPVCYLPKNGAPYLIDLPGSPIGIFPDSQFSTREITTQPGDKFFIYSDGLIERSGTGKVWTASTDLLLTMIERVREIPISKVSAKLDKLMARGLSTADDDIVVMAVEV